MSKRLRTNKADLKSGYIIYGNKGNVMGDTAHIYELSKGNLCGTPALSTNHASLKGIEVAGCSKCNEVYSSIK